MRRFSLALVAALCAASAGHAEDALAVDLMKAASSALTRTFSVTGEIQAADSVPIGAKDSGRVRVIHVSVGDQVVSGQVLAELDPTQAAEAVRAAEAQLAAAEASLKQADQSHARAASLVERGAGTRSDLDAAIEALDAARSKRDQMVAQLSKARQSLADVVIRADGPAVVTERNAEPGQVVSAAETILTLARDAGREAIFHAPDGMNLAGLLGREITLHTLDAPILEAHATITEIAPVTDSASGTVKITATLVDDDPRPGLGAAVMSDISIDLPQAFSVPWSALAILDGNPAVWVANADTKRVDLKPVTIGRYTESSIEISGGLQEGDLVVGKGSNFLYPGQLVRGAGDKE